MFFNIHYLINFNFLFLLWRKIYLYNFFLNIWAPILLKMYDTYNTEVHCRRQKMQKGQQIGTSKNNFHFPLRFQHIWCLLCYLYLKLRNLEALIRSTTKLLVQHTPKLRFRQHPLSQQLGPKRHAHEVSHRTWPYALQNPEPRADLTTSLNRLRLQVINAKVKVAFYIQFNRLCPRPCCPLP